MRLVLDRQKDLPLNEQIRDAVLEAITGGEVSPGERLPPARQLAWALRVNVHTVLKAYGELARNGVVEIRRGGGTSVRQDFSISIMGRMEGLRAAAHDARNTGVSLAQAQAILEEVWR